MHTVWWIRTIYYIYSTHTEYLLKKRIIWFQSALISQLFTGNNQNRTKGFVSFYVVVGVLNKNSSGCNDSRYAHKHMGWVWLLYGNVPCMQRGHTWPLVNSVSYVKLYIQITLHYIHLKKKLYIKKEKNKKPSPALVLSGRCQSSCSVSASSSAGSEALVPPSWSLGQKHAHEEPTVGHFVRLINIAFILKPVSDPFPAVQTEGLSSERVQLE